MNKFKVGDRVFISVSSGWTDDVTEILGWTGTVATANARPAFGYGIILENDDVDGPAYFGEREISSLNEYNEWVAGVISGDINVTEVA